MNIHYLQHESFEDLAAIQRWADKPNNKITCTKFFEKYTLPKVEDIDMLIVMGGPMGVYDEDKFAWLKDEKKFIKEAINKKKKVIGICLGSQLIAEVLGAKVYKNHEKEIGWLDVKFTEASKSSKFFKDFPSTLKVFQWHGDTFDLPPGAVHIAESAACKHQAFTYRDHVVALQFHIEASNTSVEELVSYCGDELVDAPYIQKEKDIIKNIHLTEEINNWMFKVLDRF